MAQGTDSNRETHDGRRRRYRSASYSTVRSLILARTPSRACPPNALRIRRTRSLPGVARGTRSQRNTDTLLLRPAGSLRNTIGRRCRRCVDRRSKSRMPSRTLRRRVSSPLAEPARHAAAQTGEDGCDGRRADSSARVGRPSAARARVPRQRLATSLSEPARLGADRSLAAGLV